MGWFSDSKEDGMKDGEKGRSDPIREFFDEDYKKGVDIGEGIRDGEKARRELDKHPIAGPIVDALGGEGLDKFGKSKDFCRTYDRVKKGESPRKVFGDEIRKSEKATREEHTRTEDYTISYTTSDSSASQLETMPMPALMKWLIGLGLIGVVSIGVRSYINNSQNKQPQLENSVKRTYVNQTMQNKDKKIKESLDDWINNNLNYPPVRDIGGLEYPVKISLENYSAVGKNIWATCYRHGYGGRGHLIYSRDGGENWEVLWRDDRTSFRNVHFFDDYKGLMATDGQILKSTNGGRTWEGILYVRTIPTPTIKIIDKMDVKNEDNISVRLKGHFNESIETNNGGRIWWYVIYHGRHYGSRSLKFVTYNDGRSWGKVL